MADDTCDKCGGSGMVQKWYGPFLQLIKPEQREEVMSRIMARGDLLKTVDRAVAKQMVRCLGKKINDDELLNGVYGALEDGIVFWVAEDKEAACSEFLTVLTVLVYLMEDYLRE